MSERKPPDYMDDILKCLDHIHTYTQQLSFDDFASNFMVVEACLYNVQVIGEASSHLPEEVKQDNPQIPWKLIKGMRNRLIHEYFGTDLPVIWNVIKNELPALENEFSTILTALRDGHK